MIFNFNIKLNIINPNTIKLNIIISKINIYAVRRLYVKTTFLPTYLSCCWSSDSLLDDWEMLGHRYKTIKN